MAFERHEGFEGSIPQKFADEKILRCPICGTDTPHWSLDMRKGNAMSLDPEQNANKYLFKCEQCEAILRVPVTDVVGVGRTAISLEGLAKKHHGKEVGEIYVTIESVGKCVDKNYLVEKEMTLGEINDMATRIAASEGAAAEEPEKKPMSYCRNCGKEIDPRAEICVACGYKNGDGDKYCFHCGNELPPEAEVCMSCGFAVKRTAQAPSGAKTGKSKMVAGLLGIFLGGLGIHNFYLGYTGKGVAQLLLSCVGVGFIWGLIDGIMIFTGKINTDSEGNPLVD